MGQQNAHLGGALAKYMRRSMTVTQVSAEVTVCLDQTLNPSKGL